MRLAGYLKELKDNSFAIPVYTNGNKYYFHNVDENYKIINFFYAQLIEDNFIKCYLSIDFKINGFGAYVFIGKNNYINYNILSESIYEINNYLRETTDDDKFVNVKQDVKSFIKYLNNSLVVSLNLDAEKESKFIGKALYAGKIADVINNNVYNEMKLISEKNIDIADFLLEETFSKFLFKTEILSEIFKVRTDIKDEFITFINFNETDENLKNIIFSKLLSITLDNDITNRSVRLKQYNYNFGNKTIFFNNISSNNTVNILIDSCKGIKESETKKHLGVKNDMDSLKTSQIEE